MIKTVIMAGGKGTRIASVNSELPKPMIPIAGKPILEYEIECLRSQGYQEIYLVTGYLECVIKAYFGDGAGISPATGQPFGVKIHYITEQSPLGTAGALYLLKDELKEDFLLLNGDIIFDIDIERFYQFHKKNDSIATLFTHPNDHPFDSGILFSDYNGQVKKWLHKENTRKWYPNRINAGIHFLSPRIFNNNLKICPFRQLEKLDLDRDVLEPLIETGQIYSYQSPEYVKDMGTPERLYQVSKDLKIGRVKQKCLKHIQKAIFIDRDGTINHYVGFLKNIDDFALLSGVGQAIKKLNQSGYLAIMVTNQPVIARGELTFDQLNEIHNKMETLLGQQGAYLDASYLCPHHPDCGFPGEISELKFDCNCRKPKPGMLLQAAADYHIDLSQSWMVGDSETDIQAGLQAGCKTAYIGNSESLKSCQANCIVYNLLEFVERLLCEDKVSACT